MNPMTHGLPALKSYNGPLGEERLLFLGIEAATKGICKGWDVAPEDYRFYRKLGQRVQGLMDALDHRVDMMQGGEG